MAEGSGESGGLLFAVGLDDEDDSVLWLRDPVPTNLDSKPLGVISGHMAAQLAHHIQILNKAGGTPTPVSLDWEPLLQVIAQLLRTRRVAQLSQRLRLNLADALACDLELASDLFERPAAVVLKPEAQL